MDISWAAIGKILIAGLASYVLLPAALILRDFILWKLINAYILNTKLREAIKRQAILINLWKKTYAVNKNTTLKDGKTTYSINNKSVTKEKMNAHEKDSENVKKSIEENEIYIKRKSNLLTWLLKHYKQDNLNPINEWLKKDTEQLKAHEENTANK